VPFGDDGAPAWAGAKEVKELRGGSEPQADASFVDPPAAALREKSYRDWEKSLAAHLYQHARLQLLRCASLKLASEAGETEGDFRSRIALALRERRDAEVDRLRDRYATKLRSLQDQLRRAEERLAREQEQYSQRKLDTVVSVGNSVLDAIFGGRRSAASRAGTAARSAGRVLGEKNDVDRANAGVEELRTRFVELEREVEQTVAAVTASYDAGTASLEGFEVAPRKADITVDRLQLAWEPWRRSAQGTEEPAWQA
jgi:hypothetical protein